MKVTVQRGTVSCLWKTDVHIVEGWFVGRQWSVGTSHKPAGGPQQHYFGRTAALLLASAKHQRSARGGSFSGPRPNINAALGAALLRASTKQLHNDGCGPSQGLGLLSRSVVLTNHRRLTNPATSIKGDRLGLRNQ